MGSDRDDADPHPAERRADSSPAALSGIVRAAQRAKPAINAVQMRRITTAVRINRRERALEAGLAFHTIDDSPYWDESSLLRVHAARSRTHRGTDCGP